LSAHLAHRIHQNSRAAYEAEDVKLSARAEAVFEWIRQHGPHTDREVMRGMGFQEPNSVRPRITELIGAGKLMEVCSRRCAITGKSVRVVDLRGQRKLFA
jgi:hypothetical protein